MKLRAGEPTPVLAGTVIDLGGGVGPPGGGATDASRPLARRPSCPGYTYVRLLGSGGFTDVFLYEQQLPRRKVAVKVLLAEELERDTQRAVRRRGEPHGAAVGASVHRHDLPRRRRGRRPPVLRHGVLLGPEPRRALQARAASPSPTRCAPACASPAPSRPRTPPASCTATSSRPTCSRTTTAGRRSPTSASPRTVEGELPVHTMTAPATTRHRRRLGPVGRSA